MNNTEFSKRFLFRKYEFKKFNHTDNHKNTGAQSNFIGMMLKGTAVFKTRSSSLNIKEGDVFFIPKNELYQSWWYGDENNHIEFLSLSAQNLPLSGNVRYTLQKINCSAETKNLLFRIMDDLSVNCKTVGLFYSFLGEVFENMERKTTQHEIIIEKALDYMYLNDNFQIKDVASYCDVSEATIYNVFSKNLKKTPNQIKQQVLCEKAVRLLTTTTLSVEEISSHLQFSSSSYFRKIFKKYINKTPRQIRKETII